MILVWEESGRWKGFCWLGQAAEGTKTEEFGVDDARKGVGSRFFSATLEHFYENDDRGFLWLVVAADNSRATRFYESFGFVRSALEKAVWNRRWGPITDALIMKHMQPG